MEAEEEIYFDENYSVYQWKLIEIPPDLLDSFENGEQ
jgi:hypothetical protein